MAEKTLAHVQERTKEGRLVIPLDHPRSHDYNNEVINKAAASSGALYIACSGRDVYIKELLVTEYSGNDSNIKLVDASGDITPYIPIAANTCVTWDPRPSVCGPLHETSISGCVVFYNTDGAFYGAATLIVQIDPQINE